MAGSVRNTNKFRSNFFIKHFDADPNADTPTVVTGWHDAQFWRRVLLSFMRTIGTSDITLKLRGSASSDGSNSVVLKEHAFELGQPNAVGDNVFIEFDTDECPSLLPGCRYVAGEISFATDTDEGVVTLMAESKITRPGLTEDVIA